MKAVYADYYVFICLRVCVCVCVCGLSFSRVAQIVETSEWIIIIIKKKLMLLTPV